MAGKPRIFIDGESGTTGLQIRTRLEGRSDLAVVSIDPARRKDADERRRLLNQIDLAVLCLPDQAAREAVAMIENPEVKVLDASTAHRVDPDWVYGFPEMSPEQASLIRGAKRVANPGCYATGAIALLRPLVLEGLMRSDYPASIHAVQGYSGGGRQMIESFEADGPNRVRDPYRLYSLQLAHKHLPEIQRYSGLSSPPLFWPAVGRWFQGMLVQVPLHFGMLPKTATAESVVAVYRRYYEGCEYIRVMDLQEKPPAALAPEAWNGTNVLELWVFANPELGQALLVARGDNLGKGASGAAVQNLDLMLGLTAGAPYTLARQGAAMVG
ncbi:MAG: N-acetyl-gamma-glutamyl-phosphate reductase [Verrucomicrobia bacterium]|nr:N-acetyl-gamma-glutamyl-phosphate reductase [Verrucomicrobiota bacterium]